jgi:hypothetical protein
VRTSIVHRLVAALAVALPAAPPTLAVAVGGLAAGGCNSDEVVPPDAPSSGCGDCDAPTDANDFCTTCGPDQICVQFIDGVCGQLSLRCEDRNPACATGNACTPECMQWHCNNGDAQPFYRCDVGGCPVDVAGALHCYGP